MEVEVEMVEAAVGGWGAVWRPLPRGRDQVARNGEGLNLMGHKFTLRGATSAFYQPGPDSVTGDDCLQIGHWAF